MSAKETRHTKLLQLIEEYGTIERLAQLTERSSAYLSQLKNKSKGRGMGNEVARKFEESLGLPDGWMDHPESPPPGEVVSKEVVYFRKLTREQREAVVVILESMVDRPSKPKGSK